MEHCTCTSHSHIKWDNRMNISWFWPMWRDAKSTFCIGYCNTHMLHLSGVTFSFQDESILTHLVGTRHCREGGKKTCYMLCLGTITTMLHTMPKSLMSGAEICFEKKKTNQKGRLPRLSLDSRTSLPGHQPEKEARLVCPLHSLAVPSTNFRPM